MALPDRARSSPTEERGPNKNHAALHAAHLIHADAHASPLSYNAHLNDMATGASGLSFVCKLPFPNQMQFELTEEQLQMKMSVREFAEAEIAPHVMEWDESQHFPIELVPKLGELGLT